MENTEIMTAVNAEMLENVLVNGDLARLSAPQRLDYYRQVCQSMGLNPLSKPFDYINLNGKLTLYAKKDATDQLRKINGVSIDDVQQDFEGDLIIVTVKGSDREGRRDVEMGVVNKNEMRGNVGNAMMKAMTKAKRRLTLSLCGLGWLDESEVETIPDAKPVIVDNNGEIIGQPKPVEVLKAVETPKPEQKKQFDEVEFLRGWNEKATVIVDGRNVSLPDISIEMACDLDTTNKDGSIEKMGKRSVGQLAGMWRAYKQRLSDPNANQEDVLMRLSAVNKILTEKAKAQKEFDRM